MSALRLLAVCAAMAAPVAVWAGDPSGFDTAGFDQCFAAATSDNGRADCIQDAGEKCEAFVADRFPEVSQVDRTLNCLDAERQHLDARLGETYDKLKADEQERGAERADALVTMERAWIAFRDARCAYDKITNGHGTGGIVFEPMCLRDETGRQLILLTNYQSQRN
ncbi:MAG: hypothetical protein DI498_11165 [Paracoccus denitrificans]|nr:MAG: hypothetical protein DI498_11165 [Paracoccus denitrificans]PZO83548.1 MAG: hypothetical protein DI633_11165 [Paracoccus denitrificans]